MLPRYARPISCGDLLRALRLRAGLTQAGAARLAEISQGMLARWENSGALPDAQRLHALCYALGASAEETAELTTSRLIPQEPLPTDEDELTLSFVHLTHVTQTANKSLGFLAHAAQFARLIRDGRAPAQRQAEVWARQAQYAQRFGEAPKEVCVTGERALLAVPDAVLNGHLTAGVVTVANARARMSGPRAGARYLTYWRERVISPVYRGWIECCLAEYLMQASDADPALAIAAGAYEATRAQADRFPGDFLVRTQDYAELLLKAWKAPDALAVVNARDPVAHLGSSPQWCQNALLLAEIRWQLGQRGQALNSLIEAQTLVHEQSLPYKERVARLARLMGQ